MLGIRADSGSFGAHMSIQINPSQNLSQPTKRAFTLVELLVVIAIIALLVAILLPALNGARLAGRKAGTQNMMTALNNASTSFSNDNGSRMPGYFSPSQMGHSDNEVAGMSAMENVLVELGGTDVILGQYSDNNAQSQIDEDAGIISLAPFNNAQDNAIVVNTNLIGTSGAYFAPDSNFLATMDHESGQQSPAGDKPNFQHLMPDLVDSFGTPLLAWSMDESALGSIDPDGGADNSYRQFASISSDDMGDMTSGPAWFYMMSNETFFGEDVYSSGGGSKNQYAASTLSSIDQELNPVDALDRIRTLTTALASPSYYVLESSNDLESADFKEIYASRPRGRLIFQSAGIDGVYFSANDNAWKANAHSEPGSYHLDFGNNYKNQSGVRLEDETGKKITIDIIEEFDDIMSSLN